MSPYRAPAEAPLLTIEEYERLPDDGYRDELVRGRLVREPQPGTEHGWLAVEIAGLLRQHVVEHGGGIVLVGSGFVLSEVPPTVRGPDVSFVSVERLPPGPLPAGFLRLAPDLAVEIVSPSNTAAGIQEKVFEYLDAGTRLVWVVYPGRREFTLYRSREEIRVLTEGDALTGGDLLPGLAVPLAELFRPPGRRTPPGA
ncbi:MAG TPA: Uma2 family endonuclease [Longimicrobiales bacterium]|nr:Uma2 family endonuclease [Longimicrobiales bacterium]